MKAFLAWWLSVDHWLLLKINRNWTHPVLNTLMPLFTDIHHQPWFRYGAVPIALAVWLWKGRKRTIQVIVVAGLAVGSADLVAYRLIKPMVARPRPELAGEPVKLRAPASGTWSFPSNHAINMGAAAAVLSVAYPADTFVFAVAAIVVCYSRVYVGAHYPSDVLGGLLLGILIGWIWGRLMLEAAGPPAKKKKP